MIVCYLNANSHHRSEYLEKAKKPRNWSRHLTLYSSAMPSQFGCTQDTAKIWEGAPEVQPQSNIAAVQSGLGLDAYDTRLIFVSGLLLAILVMLAVIPEFVF